MKCPHCFKIIKNNISTMNKLKRLELIKETFDKYKSIETVYIIVRKKGYRMARRTFGKDIKIIQEQSKESKK